MTLAARVSLILMAALYTFAGVMHFVAPAAYVQMMPPYLPWHLFLVYLSGVCEIGLALLLLAPRTRRLAAWGVILLLVAVFPANVHMALHHISPPGLPTSPIMLWLRLPVQGLLIAWAYSHTGPVTRAKHGSPPAGR